MEGVRGIPIKTLSLKQDLQYYLLPFFRYKNISEGSISFTIYNEDISKLRHYIFDLLTTLMK